MAQRDATNAPTFAAGFDFARRLREPNFRALLKKLGASGQHVVIAVDDELVVDVIARMTFHETGGRAFIAVEDAVEPYGFRVLLVAVAHEPPDDDQPDRIELGHGASIGMLSELLRPCGTYIPPSMLTRNLIFERVATG